MFFSALKQHWCGIKQVQYSREKVLNNKDKYTIFFILQSMNSKIML